MIERWLPIGGYEDRYKVSDFGNIRSKSRARKLHPNNKGYLRIQFWNSSDTGKANRTNYSVHRLVWEAFMGSIPAGMDIDHIDGVRTNNSLTNLRLATKSQNAFNSVKVLKVSSSVYKGVIRIKGKSRITPAWGASIRIAGRQQFIGSFSTELQAAIAYDLKAIEARGAFARTNIIHTADFIERNNYGNPPTSGIRSASRQ